MNPAAILTLSALLLTSVTATADYRHQRDDRDYGHGNNRAAPARNNNRATPARGNQQHRNHYGTLIRPVLSFGYDFGGERVGSATFDDGSNENLDANQGVNFAGGISVPLQQGLSLQSTVGYHTGSVDAPNGDMRWSNFPWETTLQAQVNQITLGGGVVYHVNPKFKSGGVLTELGDYKFDDAMGFQVQAAWSPYSYNNTADLSLGVKYTSVDFELNDSDTEIDGDTLGVFMSYKF